MFDLFWPKIAYLDSVVTLPNASLVSREIPGAGCKETDYCASRAAAHSQLASQHVPTEAQ